MKLLPLLVLACSSALVTAQENTDSSKQELLARASAQLERLAPYRRSFSDQAAPFNEQWQLLENAAKDPGIKELSEQQAFQIYRLLPENMQRDIANKVGGNRAMIELLASPRYMELMQDRIKRSGTKREVYGHDGYEAPSDGYNSEGYGGYAPESYGGHYEEHPQSSDSGQIIKGSTSLIGGIAKGIIGGIVGASGSSSQSSSSISAQSSKSSVQSSSSSSEFDKKKPKPEYGQVYSYGEKAFDVWDFKKAIISTLMQAVKAISGGVIALKGQLIKGSGYLVSTKGKIITKAGDAVTTLGRNIAKNAVQPHPPPPPHHGYVYDHPEGGLEESYEGPPPNVEDYAEGNEEYHGNANYESSSDVGDQAGLLIVKPTNQDDHDHQPADVEKPALTQPEDTYYGPPPELPNKDVDNSVTGGSYHNFHQAEHHNSVAPPATSYDVPLHQPLLNDHNGQHYPIYPPLTSGAPLNLHTPPVSIQQSVEYPPIHIQYSPPHKGSLDLPHGDTSSNDLSVYSSVSIDVQPTIASIKLSPLKPAALELPKLQSHVNFGSAPLLPNSFSKLQEPLKIPLLNSYGTPFWQNQPLLQPLTNFNLHGLYRRRSSAQKRRSIGEVAQRMRLQRG